MNLFEKGNYNKAFMKLRLISCIVPVFNGERYLREALGSIFAQTYRPLEIIVADDGSADGTADIVAAATKAWTQTHGRRHDQRER